MADGCVITLKQRGPDGRDPVRAAAFEVLRRATRKGGASSDTLERAPCLT